MLPLFVRHREVDRRAVDLVEKIATRPDDSMPRGFGARYRGEGGVQPMALP
jgi:hypothetical protein